MGSRLGVCATLARALQEQVGLLIAALAVWLWFRHPDRRRAAVILGAGALAWVVIAFAVILPSFALEGVNPHLSRYSSLGDSPAEILLSFVTRPWDVAEIVLTPGRLAYVLGPAGRHAVPGARGAPAGRLWRCRRW